MNPESEYNKWLSEHEEWNVSALSDPDKFVARYAVEKGKIPLKHIVHAALNAALCSSDCEMLKFLDAEYSSYIPNRIDIPCVVSSKVVDTLLSCHSEYSFEFTKNQDQIDEILEILMKYDKPPFTKTAIAFAPSLGFTRNHFNLLLEKGAVFSQNFCLSACLHRNLQIVKYLFEISVFPPAEYTFSGDIGEMLAKAKGQSKNEATSVECEYKQ